MLFILQHIGIEGPGLIKSFFENCGYECKIVKLFKGEKIPPLGPKVKGVVILGGPMGVYEEGKYPFLKEEDIFLKKIIDKDFPTLGICLGAQLLAKAKGAIVKKSPSKEIGWYKVFLTAEGRKDRLFKGLDKTLEVFQWHEDTFTVPEGATLVCRGLSCRNQAIRIGKNIYGLQFHIEVGISMIKDWIAAYSNTEGKGTRYFEKILNQSYSVQKNFRKLAYRFLSNFKDILKD
jgi:GMP synthase-like glutamine amidotransferase